MFINVYRAQKNNNTNILIGNNMLLSLRKQRPHSILLLAGIRAMWTFSLLPRKDRKIYKNWSEYWRGLPRRRSLGGKGVFRDAWCVIGPKLASWEVIWHSRVMRDLLFSQRVTRDFPLKFPWWLMSFEARSSDWLIIDSYDTNFLPSFLDLWFPQTKW